MQLYVHVPFCRSKCQYCDFSSWAGHEHDMQPYVDAVLKEAAIQYEHLHHPLMHTAFIGGGTPSVLPVPLWNRLLDGLTHTFSFAKGCEWTTEANPGTLTPAWLDSAVSHGINRLSLGMQALQPELLRTLGRIHDFAQVQQSVSMARASGIHNISLDLMFGLPGQTRAMWLETLKAALSLSPRHLSCYGLIPEEGTPLVRRLSLGQLVLPDEEEERAMYDDCLTLLAQHGFEQYEISNFALPGFRCSHNLGYWRQVPYLGLGVSAASMLPSNREGCAYERLVNPSTLPGYLRMMDQNDSSMRETEPVSPLDARFETMMLALRTTQGVSAAEFERMHHCTLEACYGEKLVSLEKRGLLCRSGDWWRLTRRGMDIQNSILVELMDD